MLKNILKFKLNSGQSIIEYSVLLIIIMAGVITMGPYVVRSWHAHVKGYQDSVDDSRSDPLDQSNENPGIAPRCLCHKSTPTICLDPDKPCCGSYGCSATEEAVIVEVCTPMGCKKPEDPVCRSNKECCGPWINQGCGDTVDFDKCQGHQGEMYQIRTCGEGRTEERCLTGHPDCNFACHSPPDTNGPKGQKYGDVCQGDEDDLVDETPYTLIPEGSCDNPGINNLAKCQRECKLPFFPSVNPINGYSCTCPSGEEVLDETVNPPKLICKCAGLIESCETSPGVIGLSAAGCDDGKVKVCTNNWDCCTKFTNTNKKLTTEFSEITPILGLAGVSCDPNYIATKIFAKNTGSGVTWQLQCHNIQPSCLTGNTAVSVQFDSASPTIVNSTCPSGFVMTGIKTTTTSTGQLWSLECSEVNSTCLNSNISVPSPKTFISGPIGSTSDETPPCFLMNSLETQRTSGVNEWRIYYIQ